MTHVGVFTQSDRYFNRPRPLSGRCYAKQEPPTLGCRKLLTEIYLDVLKLPDATRDAGGAEDQLGVFTHPAGRIFSNGTAVYRG
jgi:hypothetical protein